MTSFFQFFPLRDYTKGPFHAYSGKRSIPYTPHLTTLHASIYGLTHFNNSHFSHDSRFPLFCLYSQRDDTATVHTLAPFFSLISTCDILYVTSLAFTLRHSLLDSLINQFTFHSYNLRWCSSTSIKRASVIDLSQPWPSSLSQHPSAYLPFSCLQETAKRSVASF